MSFAVAGALAAVCSLGRPAVAAPPRSLYTISIGHNDIPGRLRTPANEGLVALRYADDDAVYFHSFMRDFSRRAFLLAVLDADTQSRFAGLAGQARVPTRAALAGVLAEVQAAMEQDRAAGREPVLVLFYSGHGVRDESGAPALAMLDGALNQAWLYEQVLAKLPARFVHLIVDACHAEAVVRPRDAEARIEHMEEAERQSYVQASTLARFPQVGALLASTAGAQSFEWDAYRGGVFAHEVLSGLRGAADVNGDGQIEYSELAAFVAAANLQVADPRVRPEVVVQPPRADRRAPIVDLSTIAGSFRLVGRAAGSWAGPFFLESENGVRVLDSFPEPGARLAYRLPADQPLYLVGPAGEVALTPAAGQDVTLDSLAIGQPRTRARGALESSMRKGLFATAFGPAFYRGYVSRQEELVTVEFTSRDTAVDRGAPASRWNTRRIAGTALLAVGGLAAVTAGIFGALAWNARSRYDDTSYERPAAAARADFDRYRRLGITGGVAAVALGAAGAAVLYWPRSPAPGAAMDGVAFTGSGLVVAGSF